MMTELACNGDLRFSAGGARRRTPQAFRAVHLLVRLSMALAAVNKATS